MPPASTGTGRSVDATSTTALRSLITPMWSTITTTMVGRRYVMSNVARDVAYRSTTYATQTIRVRAAWTTERYRYTDPTATTQRRGMPQPQTVQ